MTKLQSYVNLVIIGTLLLIGLDTPKEKYVGPVNYVMDSVVDIKVSVTIERSDLFGDVKEFSGTIGGSGVFVSKKGYVLTCAHLFNISGLKKIHSIILTSPNGDSVFGRLIKVNSKSDLAVVRADYYHKTPYVKIADPRDLRVGQEVFAIGSPLGLTFSVSHGIISALYRDFDNFAYNVTQSDTAINPGNSGGPLFNLKGELVGINSFIVSANDFVAVFSGIGFSVQCGQLREFLTDVKKTEKDLVL